MPLFKDVVKMNTYIVNFNSELDLPIFRKIRNKFLGNADFPASTLVGVAVLGNKIGSSKLKRLLLLNKVMR